MEWGEPQHLGGGLYCLLGPRPCASQIALTSTRDSVLALALALASALWAAGLIDVEPLPVHLMLPKGGWAVRARSAKADAIYSKSPTS